MTPTKLYLAQQALVRTIHRMPFGSEDDVGRQPDCDICGDLQRYDDRTESPVCLSCAEAELARLAAEPPAGVDICPCGQPMPDAAERCPSCLQAAKVDA